MPDESAVARQVTDHPPPFTVHPLPHEALGASALFRATVAGDPAARRFYRHAPADPDALAEAARIAADAATARGTRDAVAAVLAAQNAGWGTTDRVLAQVERLRLPDAAAVVTGQQLGLFCGPLYTIWKARTAVRLAAGLEARTGRPAVPVFWLADEDHDFAEIRTAAFADGEHVRLASYDDGAAPAEDRGPVGRIVLDEVATERALQQLDAALPAGPHRAEALALARDAYVPGRTMRDAFARLLVALVPDVVLMSADDARLKRLGHRLFAQEIDTWDETLAALEARSAALVGAGFHAQVAPSPVNLFVMGEGHRTPLDPVGGGGFELRGTGEVISADALLARLESAPESLSPNVVLRPLFQDTLLPTAAYVAGPGEAAYFAQLGPVYERFGVPMPVVAPRLGLTVVEPAVQKVLDRYGLAVPDLREDLDALWRRFALEASGTDLDGVFAEATAAVTSSLDALRQVVMDVDAGLESAVGAARAKAENALAALATKTVRSEKRNHEVVRARLARAQAALWPGGRLQERALGPLGLVARHGRGALADLVAAVDGDGTAHHVVRT